MISTRLSKTIWGGLLGGGALCIAFSLPSAAQVQTSKTVAHGEPTKQVTVERGTIVHVSGNSVVVKMEDGKLEHFNNVPDTLTFMVDGKPVNIHDAKPGMVLEKQTITTTTPRMITTVETVTGRVWHVSPPNSVILTLENGQNQRFEIPRGQRFMVNGQETDAWGLRKGMTVSAQRVTEVPETVVTQEIQRTGTAPPPPPPPRADIPILVVVARPVPAPPAETAAAEPAPTKLPKTASDLPLIALLGTLCCGLSLIAMSIRGIFSRFAR
jgi:hypothetical protein